MLLRSACCRHQPSSYSRGSVAMSSPQCNISILVRAQTHIHTPTHPLMHAVVVQVCVCCCKMNAWQYVTACHTAGLAVLQAKLLSHSSTVMCECSC